MGGNQRRAIVIQERDRQLLKELSILRVLDREQAKIVAPFHSTTRANNRLLALTNAGLLRRFFLGTSSGGQKALYALSPEGAKIVDVPYRGPRRRRDEVLVADLFVTHGAPEHIRSDNGPEFVAINVRAIPGQFLPHRLEPHDQCTVV